MGQTIVLNESRIGPGARPHVAGTGVASRRLMRRVLAKLHQERLRYCVLRDADRLDRRSGEVDLLVDRSDLDRLANVLRSLGFVRLRAWGYASHRFFLAYDSESDGWLKLDVIDRLAYGRSPVLGASLTDRCLKDRRLCGSVYVPSPEDELVALLLHCVLERRRFDPSRRDRCRVLCTEVTDTTYLAALLTTYWSPTMTVPKFIQSIQEGNWEALLTQTPADAAATRPVARLGSQLVRIGRGVLRRLNRRMPILRPRALTVAVLAPDGAGKSTLVKGIHASFQMPVRSIYMGLYRRSSDRESRRRPPGASFVFRLFRQWGRYLMACHHRAQGRFVIFDRYSYDAMLPPRAHLSWHSRCRRWLLAHACPAPDLLIVLDAPGEVLYQRKQEHTAIILNQQRHAYLQMAKRPRGLVIDATRDAESVRREVTSFVWSAYTSQTF